LQSRYVAATHPLERRAIGVDFECAVRELDANESERAAREREQQQLRELLDQLDEVDLDVLAADMDRAARATWCRDLRRAGRSYRAIGEQVGMAGPKVRRELLWLEQAVGWKMPASVTPVACVRDQSTPPGSARISERVPAQEPLERRTGERLAVPTRPRHTALRCSSRAFRASSESE
jgi:hypothetical protein